MTFSVTHMVLAACHYKEANGDVKAAVRGLRDQLQKLDLEAPSDLLQFVKTWGPRMQADGSIKSLAHNSGRKQKLTVEQLNICHDEATGWFAAGMPGPYASMEALMSQSEKVKAIVEATGVSAETLSRRLKELFPGFRYGVVATKDVLDDAQKSARVEDCHHLLEMSERERNTVVWVDSKSMILVVKRQRAWIDTDVCDYEERRRPPQLGNQIINLKYYIGVNALLGPFWFAFTTGTTGLAATGSHPTYMVSSGKKQPWGAPTTHVRRRRPQLLSPPLGAGALAGGAVGIEPQHTETVGHGGGCQLVVLLCPSTHTAVPSVSTSVKLAGVLLSLHFNQQVGWLQRCCVPPVQVGVQHAAVTNVQLLLANGGMGFHSKALNEGLFGQAFI